MALKRWNLDKAKVEIIASTMLLNLWIYPTYSRLGETVIIIQHLTDFRVFCKHISSPLISDSRADERELLLSFSIVVVIYDQQLAEASAPLHHHPHLIWQVAASSVNNHLHHWCNVNIETLKISRWIITFQSKLCQPILLLNSLNNRRSLQLYIEVCLFHNNRSLLHFSYVFWQQTRK